MPIFRGLNAARETAGPVDMPSAPQTPNVRDEFDMERMSGRSESDSPIPPKEPTEYHFEACLTYCCFKYDHLKGVALFSVLTLLIALSLVVFFVFHLARPLVTWINPEEAIQLLTLISFSPFIYGLLFIGCLTRRRLLMLPWIVYTFIQIMFFAGTFLYKVFKMINDKESGPENLVILLSAAVATVFLTYFWSVVWSLYIRLGDADDRIHRQ